MSICFRDNCDPNNVVYYFACPHCDVMCEVEEKNIRCQIFRHAVFKKNLRFVDPHATKEVCEKWKREGLILGCGKPFMFDGNAVKKCDYI